MARKSKKVKPMSFHRSVTFQKTRNESTKPIVKKEQNSAVKVSLNSKHLREYKKSRKLFISVW